METRIKCTSCKYGTIRYEGTEEIRGIWIEIDEKDLRNKDCPKCGEKTLIKFEI